MMNSELYKYQPKLPSNINDNKVFRVARELFESPVNRRGIHDGSSFIRIIASTNLVLVGGYIERLRDQGGKTTTKIQSVYYNLQLSPNKPEEDRLEINDIEGNWVNIRITQFKNESEVTPTSKDEAIPEDRLNNMSIYALTDKLNIFLYLNFALPLPPDNSNVFF